MQIGRDLAPPTPEHKVQLKWLAVFWIGVNMGQQQEQQQHSVGVAFGE